MKDEGWRPSTRSLSLIIHLSSLIKQSASERQYKSGIGRAMAPSNLQYHYLRISRRRNRSRYNSGLIRFT
jgi:hypothetical protein